MSTHVKCYLVHFRDPPASVKAIQCQDVRIEFDLYEQGLELLPCSEEGNIHSVGFSRKEFRHSARSSGSSLARCTILGN